MVELLIFFFTIQNHPLNNAEWGRSMGMGLRPAADRWRWVSGAWINHANATHDKSQ